MEAEEGNFAGVFTSAEAAAFVPYGNKGPSISIDTSTLILEAEKAGVEASALLEILVLHEIVHVCMMGGIAQHHASHAWILNPDYRYIHESVALKTCQFGNDQFLLKATQADVKKYLGHVQASVIERESGVHYAPYFLNFRDTPLADFWVTVRASQPASQPQNGIFDAVEKLA